MSDDWEQELALLHAAQQRQHERMAADLAREALTPLGALLERVPGVQRPPPEAPPTDFACHGKCGKRIAFFGACDECLAKHQRFARIEAIADAAATLPRLDAFRRASLTSPDLVKALGQDLIAIAVRCFDEFSTFSIVGGSLSYKTLLACALFRRVLRAGVTGDEAAFELACGARFVPVLELEDRFHVAMGATLLVLDDLGAELTSCPSGSALASQRIERSVKILHARHNAGRKTVLTMGMPLARVDEVYGAGVLGRVVDEKRSAAHVDLGGMS